MNEIKRERWSLVSKISTLELFIGWKKRGLADRLPESVLGSVRESGKTSCS